MEKTKVVITVKSGDSSLDLPPPKKLHLHSLTKVQSFAVTFKDSGRVIESTTKKEPKSTNRKPLISPSSSDLSIPAATEKQIPLPSHASAL